MRRIALFAGLFVIGLGLTVPAAQNDQRNPPGQEDQNYSIDDEAGYDKAMKQVGVANAALRKEIDTMNADKDRTNVQWLRLAFMQVGDFWQERGKKDAAKWADDARRILESMDNQMSDSKWDSVKASAGDLGKVCQSCHAAYRDKAPDGTFRIKPGTN